MMPLPIDDSLIEVVAKAIFQDVEDFYDVPESKRINWDGWDANQKSVTTSNALAAIYAYNQWMIERGWVIVDTSELDGPLSEVVGKCH